MKKEIAIFGMGCFWGPEKLFSEIEGVTKTEVGFMGGKEDKEEVSYESVCAGESGHTEVVKIEFDSGKISYSDLLELFWKNHDATQKDMQGPDTGKQYRSIIFYLSDKQKKKAEDSLQKTQKKIGTDRKIVTEIVKAGKFYKAEEYHQDYIKKTSGACHFGSTF